MNKIGKIGSIMFKTLAERSISDKNRVSSIIRTSLNKLKENPNSFAKIWRQTHLLIELLKDWVTGNYQDISRSSLITLVAGLIYFIVPTDILPDIIPATGLIDDISVLTFVLTKISPDIEKYEQWKKACTNNKREDESSIWRK